MNTPGVHSTERAGINGNFRHITFALQGTDTTICSYPVSACSDS
ncbi:hypothetical protein BvCmsKSNP075_03917 [Escherichia coli]|nr:hypothetical protein BvCmsB22A_04453 [Escherichia coli]GCL23207.1 hypothetical protein BvCmsE63A_01706 [Escherichia coli]GCO71024.1 hypothetical protein BvCms244_00257 [Escherichia coli]GDE94496.1 hypothetical protein BvCmsKKNP001_04519 [Escherichia coli]GDI87801.1 hypothetical protein BvCmsKKNP025_01800 [Escherichia coli]